MTERLSITDDRQPVKLTVIMERGGKTTVLTVPRCRDVSLTFPSRPAVPLTDPFDLARLNVSPVTGELTWQSDLTSQPATLEVKPSEHATE